MPFPAEVSLSLARTTDVQTIADMSRRLVEAGLPWSWTAARVARHMNHPDCVALVARSRARLAGFALMHIGDELAHLNLLAVDPAFQRQGIGRRLIDWLERSASVAGAFVVNLEVRARNPVALLFYRSLGYTEAGRLPRYYCGREDALRMSRDLSCGSGQPLPGGRAAMPTPLPVAGQVTADWLLTKFRR